MNKLSKVLIGLIILFQNLTARSDVSNIISGRNTTMFDNNCI